MSKYLKKVWAAVTTESEDGKFTTDAVQIGGDYNAWSQLNIINNNAKIRVVLICNGKKAAEEIAADRNSNH